MFATQWSVAVEDARRVVLVPPCAWRPAWRWTVALYLSPSSVRCPPPRGRWQNTAFSLREPRWTIRPRALTQPRLRCSIAAQRAPPHAVARPRGGAPALCHKVRSFQRCRYQELLLTVHRAALAGILRRCCRIRLHPLRVAHARCACLHLQELRFLRWNANSGRSRACASSAVLSRRYSLLS